VTTGEIAATKKACAESRMAAEQRFFRMLAAVDTAEKDADQLVLSGPDDVRMAFDPADEPADELTGTWDIVNIATINALTTPVKGTEPTLAFGSDGALAVDTGCNTASTTWTADGSSLTVDPLRTTLKACPEPPGVDAQEAAIFEALTRTLAVELSNGAVNHDTAVLLDEDGSTTLVLARRQ
jgi:heat shock protein HslJ